MTARLSRHIIRKIRSNIFLSAAAALCYIASLFYMSMLGIAVFAHMGPPAWLIVLGSVSAAYMAAAMFVMVMGEKKRKRRRQVTGC